MVTKIVLFVGTKWVLLFADVAADSFTAARISNWFTQSVKLLSLILVFLVLLLLLVLSL